MKKKLALLLAMMMLFSAGCGKEEAPEQPQQEIQTEFRLEEAGLAYTIPDTWVETENVNLIPASYVEVDGEIFAKIQYNYTPDENMDALNDPDSPIPVEELMTPIVEMLVVKAENLETSAVKEELALYNSVEELPAQENFRYYFLTDYATGIDHFSNDAKATFEDLEKYLSEKGILPPLPEESDPEPTSGPISFPSRTEEPISCPVCGRRQRGNRDCCYSCGVKFQYEDE